MLVSVRPVFGSEKDDKEVRAIGGHPSRAAIAWHHIILCVLGQGPCVRLTSFRYRRRKYKVTQRNVLGVLFHEEIHHVLDQIDECVAADQFDRIARTDVATKRLLGFARLGV
jgi:hypothetical protein